MKLKHLLLTLGLLVIPTTVWATCDITSDFTAGQVLTAAQLDTLVTEAESCTNNVLNGDNFTGQMNFYSGSDANGYSDAGSTLKWALDSATGDIIASPRTLGTAINCEINYAAGTVTISGRAGAALSATNPCHVGIRSNSNGVVATATFTANVTATDGSASQTDGNLFGITDANWANAMPMFLGVVYDGTTPYFTFSRKPIVVTGAAAADVCQLTDTSCDGEDDVMILTTGLTLANWVNLPVTQVGWLSATYATTGGAWTFAESAYTGFNKLYKTLRWTFPQAQYGASASTHMLPNGGTAPVFTTDQYVYEIGETGRVFVEVYMNGDGGADGAGAVTAQMALPFTFPTGGIDNYRINFNGSTIGQTTITSNSVWGGLIVENTSILSLRYLDAAANVQVITNAMYSSGARDIQGSFSFNALLN